MFTDENINNDASILALIVCQLTVFQCGFNSLQEKQDLTSTVII